MVIKATYALCLVVTVVGWVCHVSVPQRVVCQDESAWTQYLEHHLVGLYIGALVAIDEGHIKLQSQFWCLLDGIADDELYLIGHGRALYPRTCEVLLLIVDLEGIDLVAFLQSLGHAECAVATECAHLQDAPGTYHLYQHLQQSSLQVSAGHSSVQHIDVGGAPQTIQIVGLRLYVGQDICIEQ